MNAHKEAAKQRKRKSLKMALEKCMQRRDAMVAETTIAGGEEGAGSETGAGAGAEAGKEAEAEAETESGSAGTEPLTYEQQQQRMHHELAEQIKAAMAAERAQEAMDSTMNTTVNTTATTTNTTTTTTATGTTSDGSSDVEASDGSERPMEVDEQPPEPQPGSELLIIEPKIEVLSESEDEEEDRLHLHMSEPDIQAEAVYGHMPSTPTSPQHHIIPPNETPTLTSTPKVNVEQ